MLNFFNNIIIRKLTYVMVKKEIEVLFQSLKNSSKVLKKDFNKKVDDKSIQSKSHRQIEIRNYIMLIPFSHVKFDCAISLSTLFMIRIEFIDIYCLIT
ncbi:hypothetical protein BpHYR1_028471 [Brachionus plicatilis]|uniref:Uncharacterized protein n=1 Tax=Brachionus plicatilis TaxID=10195 RepID=A0A3M7ST95_BRAPC|nr:hypothetical protein BpHYR1_028471 [Brachionus plicatilis]